MSESTKTYKVKLSKTFHTQVAPGTRLSNLRHSRGGVTLSSPDHVEEVVELTKDQVEAIKNDPAFEITSVSQNAGDAKTARTPGAPSEPVTGTPEGQGGTPAPETTTPPQGDGSGTPEGEGQPSDEGSDQAGSAPASELPEATGEGAGDGDENSQDGPVVLDEAALKAIKKGNRDGAVAAATERGIEVTDQDTKAQIVDKIAASQAV